MNIKENHILALVVLVAAVFLFERHSFLMSLGVLGVSLVLLFRNHGVMLLSIIADFADYMGASIPILGDFLDLFIVAIQANRYGPRGLVGLIEIIPFADLLPVLSINAAFAEHERKHKLIT